MVAAIHDAYYAVGVDAVETNTFGANWSNLSDYGIDERIRTSTYRKSVAFFDALVGRL